MDNSFSSKVPEHSSEWSWVPIGATAVLCLVIAILLWSLVPAMGQYAFVDVLAHSMSIGLIASALTMLVIRWLNPRQKSSIIWLTACLIPVSLVAFVVGSAIARLIIGAPFERLVPGFETDDFVSMTTTIFATALCAGFFISRDQLQRIKLQAAHDGQRAETAKLAMLQAQVEPHMLFNTLANLRALIAVDPERALVMLDQLDGYLRMTLEGSRSQTNPLSKEFLGLEHYLSIMQIRLGERLSYSLELPDSLAQVQVPSLLIQPVVENAIRHGIEPQIGGGQVNVKASIEAQVLTIEVIDTGVGIDVGAGKNGSGSTSRAGDGFGLLSLRERLPDLNGEAAVGVVSPLPDGSSGTIVYMKVKV